MILQPGGCNSHGQSLAHPGVVTALNDIARELLVPAGVMVWEEPEWMSFNAPQEQYVGALHHDRCNGGCQGSSMAARWPFWPTAILKGYPTAAGRGFGGSRGGVSRGARR